jgi:hypothetical protein
MGENDIKFTRFARLYGDCIAHSVDGDYLPIALLEHERQVNILALQGDPVRIAVYRLAYNMIPAAQRVTGVKRSASESKAEKKPPREWEYVDISTLYQVLSNVMDGFSTNSIVHAHSATNSHDKHRMKIMACLIGLTGTDFTRSLPHLSPVKIWDSLNNKKVWFGLLRAFDYHTGCLLVQDTCDTFVAPLYKNNFVKHTQGSNLVSVFSSLQSSKLADRTKSQLPSVARIETTVKNINWLLIYWNCVSPIPSVVPDTQEERDTASIWDHTGCFPDAVAPEYGFKRVKKGGAVQWLDM